VKLGFFRPHFSLIHNPTHIRQEPAAPILTLIGPSVGAGVAKHKILCAVTIHIGDCLHLPSFLHRTWSSRGARKISERDPSWIALAGINVSQIRSTIAIKIADGDKLAS
jgi:hypothetical protein